jgi:hypothetical protein
MADPKIRRGQGNSRGAYLLEAALVVFGVAVFIVGIADISRIFHARGAVRAGITDGLRCLYPTDPACQSSSPPRLAPSSPRFNAWVWTSGVGIESPRSSYELEADPYDEPLRRVPFTASTLKSVVLEQPQDPYRDHRLIFPVEAHSVYLLKTRELPWVELGDGRSAGRRVLEATTSRGADFTFAPDPKNPIKGEATSSTKVLIGSVTFSVGGAGKAFDISSLTRKKNELNGKYGFSGPVVCRQDSVPDATLNWPGSTCSYRAGGESLFDDSRRIEATKLMVPLMLRIRGSRYDVDAGDEAKVTASMVYTAAGGSRDEYDLGGRVFDHGSDNANFVLRGVGRGSNAGAAYFDACDDAKYKECNKYQNLPLVAVGSDITIELHIERTEGDGSPGWKLEGIDVFYPKFNLVHEILPCGVSADPNVCGSSVSPVIADFSRADLKRNLQSELLSSNLHCHRDPPVGGFKTVAEAISQLSSSFSYPGNPPRRTNFSAISTNSNDRCTGAPPRNTYSCTGPKKEHLKGCNASFSIPEKADPKNCQLRDYRPGRDKFVDEMVDRSDTGKFDQRARCTESEYPSCAQPHIASAGQRFLGWGAQACQYAIPLPVERETRGPFFDYRETAECPGVLEGIAKEFRQRLGIPEGIGLPRLVKRQPEPPLALKERPDDECRIVNITEGSSAPMLCAQNAPSFVAERCCRDFNNQCRVDPAPPAGGGPGGGTGGGFGSINLQPAVERAQNTIAVAYPPSRTQAACRGSTVNCLDVTAELANDSSEAVMRASMDVPLMLFGWLGQEATTRVQYEERRALERSLVGGAR